MKHGALLLMAALLLLPVSVGARTVRFGTYPAGGAAIEWIVLDEDEDRMLLLAQDCIDARPWHGVRKAVTWAQCDLRTWLQEDFLFEAFTEEERRRILVSDVENGDDFGYGTPVGGDTRDRVFLLGGREVGKYLSSGGSRTASPTAYARRHGAYVNGAGTCAWWLRSPGMTPLGPAYIASNGDVGTRAHEVEETIIGVRPAMWVRKEGK